MCVAVFCLRWFELRNSIQVLCVVIQGVKGVQGLEYQRREDKKSHIVSRVSGGAGGGAGGGDIKKRPTSVMRMNRYGN